MRSDSHLYGIVQWKMTLLGIFIYNFASEILLITLIGVQL